METDRIEGDAAAAVTVLKAGRVVDVTAVVIEDRVEAEANGG